MVRRLLAAGLCAALQGGALCAPLVHAHVDDRHGDHHEAAVVHVHFGGHDNGHQNAPSLRRVRTDPAHSAAQVTGDEPEQATRLQIFVAVETAAFSAPALPPAHFVLPASLESAVRRPLEEVRSHGPPPVDTSPSRAPPALFV